MGCNVRDKHIRTNRRPRSVKPSNDDGVVSKSLAESGLNPLNYQLGLQENGQNPNPNCGPTFGANPNFDDSGWGYCTEEQLEEILLKNLGFLYNEAIAKLVLLGYDEETTLKAILKNGHCYGEMDVLTNIMHNSLAYLNSGGNDEETDPPGFTDLRQLEDYSLAGMVCMLQQVRPNLSRGDAMWCLLMNDLHVGRATVMELPVPALPGNSGSNGDAVGDKVESVCNASVGLDPAICRFHGGWGFGEGGHSDYPANGFASFASEANGHKEIDLPKRFNLTPAMKSLLNKNVAMLASGFKTNSKGLHMQSQACSSSVSNGDTSSAVPTTAEPPSEQNDETRNLKDQDVVNSMLSKFRDMNLDENMDYVPEDQKDEMIFGMIHQIKDLERQVKERKEWAHQKAMQAARKLSSDLTELKMLRMEREEIQRLKQGKPNPEDPTMKKLSEMESALRKASSQVDRANGAVRRLEIENAEIRAEMQASKLSASESMDISMDIAKKEKKYLKKLLAWEKQKAKMQEETVAEKQKILEVQKQITEAEAAKKLFEAKWKQEQVAKDLAMAQAEEERRLKEAAEASNKRRHEALRLKIEIDFQRHKDDLQRLEQEIARVKQSTTESIHQLTHNPPLESKDQRSIAKMLNELDDEDSSIHEGGSDRACIVCKKDEVCVVFLPCAHQVMCSGCSDEYGKKGKAMCPCCRAPIEQRIRVFGASS